MPHLKALALRSLALLLVLGGSLTGTACLGNGSTRIQDIQACFSHVPAAQVHPVGSTISFTVTTIHGSSTYSLPKSAFGGIPATLKDGDLITFCADQVKTGGHVTTTIAQFSDQGQPAAPVRRDLARQEIAEGCMVGKRCEGGRSYSLACGSALLRWSRWVWHTGISNAR